MFTFSRAALREIDRRAVTEFHIPIVVLMENAGRAVAEAVRGHLKKGSRVLVLAGAGNNGGDGLVAARHLRSWGFAVTILLLAPREKFKDAAAAQLAIVDAMKLPVEVVSAGHSELRDWMVESSPEDVIVDAIFGTGLTRAVEGVTAEVIVAANAARHPIVAVDIPSGMDCDTGLAVGGGPVIAAVETVSFCGMKVGFGVAAAKKFLGKATVGEVGVPVQLLREMALE